MKPSLFTTSSTPSMLAGTSSSTSYVASPSTVHTIYIYIYYKIKKVKSMIECEGRRLRWGGVCFASPPLTSSPSTSFVFSFFVFEQKGIRSRAEAGDMGDMDWTVDSEDNRAERKHFRATTQEQQGLTEVPGRTNGSLPFFKHFIETRRSCR